MFRQTSATTRWLQRSYRDQDDQNEAWDWWLEYAQQKQHW